MSGRHPNAGGTKPRPDYNSQNLHLKDLGTVCRILAL